MSLPTPTAQPVEKECSVKTCSHTIPISDRRKMCERCRNTQAEQSKKKRDRKRIKDIARGKAVTTRASSRPRPPLYRIPGIGLFTERHWEHLDERLFPKPVVQPVPQDPSPQERTPVRSDGYSRNIPPPKDEGAIELVAVKICTIKWCYQPVPIDHKRVCEYCHEKNTSYTLERKRKRDLEKVNESTSEQQDPEVSQDLPHASTSGEETLPSDPASISHVRVPSGSGYLGPRRVHLEGASTAGQQEIEVAQTPPHAPTSIEETFPLDPTSTSHIDVASGSHYVTTVQDQFEEISTPGFEISQSLTHAPTSGEETFLSHPASISNTMSVPSGSNYDGSRQIQSLQLGWVDTSLPNVSSIPSYESSHRDLFKDIFQPEQLGFNFSLSSGYDLVQPSMFRGLSPSVIMNLLPASNYDAFHPVSFERNQLLCTTVDQDIIMIDDIDESEREIDSEEESEQDENELLLLEACEKGEVSEVGRLLDKGATANVRDDENNSALQIASLRGYESVVKLLLDHGADINAQGGKYGNALQAACFDDWPRLKVRLMKLALVKLLLDRGAKVNAQGGVYGNALQAASYDGHESVVTLLLDRGAEINVQGGECGNALQAASQWGPDSVVKLLLDRGADVNAQGGEYCTALQAASHEENVSVVKLLMDRGAEINATGGAYGNALQAASIWCSEAFVRLLLDFGADVNAQGGEYGNALQAACYQDVAVVKLLLDRGADINAYGKYGNALQAACYEGNEPVVKLLLVCGADVNAQGGEYGKALQAACYDGNESVVKLLLDHGAEINAQFGEYSNTLQAASWFGYESVVSLLEFRDAEIREQAGEFGNALQAASYHGNESVVKLLNRGADFDAQVGRFSRALREACFRWNMSMIRQLLDCAGIKSRGRELKLSLVTHTIHGMPSEATLGWEDGGTHWQIKWLSSGTRGDDFGNDTVTGPWCEVESHGIR